jgi:DNA-binding NarL/FixJ family response regulator
MGSSNGERAGEIRILFAAAEADSARSLPEDLAELGFSPFTVVPDAWGAVVCALVEEPDVCVLDAELPGSAVVATAEIARLLPRIPVVILARALDEDDCLTCLLAGAAGYLLRDIGHEALAASLHCAVAGQAVLPAGAERRLLDELRTEPR